MEIRLLRADEIECRIGTINEKGLSLLLYKDARADMKILDETFGVFGWKRTHQSIDGNLYCTVEIWDNEKKSWISKQDVGTVSYTEKEKGQASDSFKRACVSVGIGRELYSAPFIWVSAQKCNIQRRNDKLICYDKFSVSEISYSKNREITALSIVNSDTGEVVYSMFPKNVHNAQPVSMQFCEFDSELKRTGVLLDTVLSRYGVKSINEMTPEMLGKAINSLKRTKTKSA
ncbi:MAG: hypothetical protein IIT39_02535 [Clostridia bacterium]|nr:hypothetical protein [Clostridia bacterium]